MTLITLYITALLKGRLLMLRNGALLDRWFSEKTSASEIRSAFRVDAKGCETPI